MFCSKVSVLLYILIISGCLNGIMTGDICGEVSVLLHIWIKSGCLNRIMTGDVL